MNWIARGSSSSIYTFDAGFWLVEIVGGIAPWSRSECMGVVLSWRDRDVSDFDWQLIFEIIIIFVTIFIRSRIAIFFKVFVRVFVALSPEYIKTINMRI